MAIQPPALPAQRTPTPWRFARLIILGLAQSLVLLFMAWLLDSVHLEGELAALAAVVVLAALNAVIWPLVIRLTLPLIVLTVGLFTFFLNAVFVELTAWIVDGFEVDSLWASFGVALALTATNLFVGGLLSIDDDHVWRQRVVRRIVKRREPPEETDMPGILFIQIDGLGHRVLTEAMDAGYAPTLKSLLDAGTHRLHPYECDLSSQTGAMQAGILLGDNRNMPAFRWYEKDTGRVLVSNKASDAAEIEARQSSGVGLLVDGGASRANVFSGDAPDSMFTFSTVTEGAAGNRFVYAVSTPYALLRILLLTLVEVVRELRDARRAKRLGIEPHGHRGGVYPFLRAGTTVVIAEITYAVLIGDIERGAPSAYVDLVGYDEVAHHSGIAAPESLETLQRTDDQLRRLFTTLDDAPRPYFVVILSDHGQTQGWTFKQRFDMTLEDLVKDLARDAVVAAPVLAEEGWNNVNAVLTDAAADDSTIGRIVKRSTRKKTVDGEVVLGPATETVVPPDADDIVVLASGNLGLLSFPDIEGRASRQEIELRYPGLIDGLRNHQGIGLLLVRDDVLGDVVLDGDGEHHLDRNEVVGADPLAHFGPNAADHLRRTSSFTNCPDLVVNSFFDPDTEEGAAFEELIGFHGGLGGEQCHPFILAPAQLAEPEGPLVGARSVHDLFKTWLHQIQGSDTTGAGQTSA